MTYHCQKHSSSNFAGRLAKRLKDALNAQHKSDESLKAWALATPFAMTPEDWASLKQPAVELGHPYWFDPLSTFGPLPRDPLQPALLTRRTGLDFFCSPQDLLRTVRVYDFAVDNAHRQELCPHAHSLACVCKRDQIVDARIQFLPLM